MRRTVSLTKGLNLNLEGGLTSKESVGKACVGRVAVVPDDFPGFVPKLDVKEGDKVSIGSPLLHDKNDPSVRLVAPAAGVVEAVVRGARRKIERVVIAVDAAECQAETCKPFAGADAATVRRALAKSGLWAMMRQRPFDVVPHSAVKPRAIMVTAMDTAPLALSLEESVKGKTAELKAGIDVLRTLCSGPIYIGVEKGSSLPDSDGVEMVEFPRLHPAGNAGVQIANIDPVNKGEVVLTLDIVTLVRIGSLALTGKPDWAVEVAVTGSEVEHPQVLTAVAGAEMSSLVGGNVKVDGRHHRVISGNVLTGVPVGEDGFLRYPYRQVTVISEGDDADEFMGWASMSPSKMSVSPSFIGRFLRRKFSPDARLNGGRRAMIMSGEYDKVFPMDILPEYLVKAILAKDIDRMEALGIYEVAPEDFALAEYVDPSKLELQKIVREGLDYLRNEV